VLTLVALGYALDNRKLFAEARTVLQRALQISPDDLETTAALSEAEEGLGDLDQAESHAARVLAAAPANATANVVLGMVHMKRGRYAEARAALERAVAAEPSSAKAHYQLSLACARLGDDAASREHLLVYQRTAAEVEKRVQKLRTTAFVPDKEPAP
jgi:tetratricopeptide (TPR) repeat protein